MTLTEDKFEDLKADYVIYGPTTSLDDLGNSTTTYSIPKDTVHTMWRPVSDEASVALYGPAAASMREGVVYDAAAELSALDQVDIDGERWEIVRIMQYQTHRLVQVRRVRG